MSIKYFPRVEGLTDLQARKQSTISDPADSTTGRETTTEAIINVLEAYKIIIVTP